MIATGSQLQLSSLVLIPCIIQNAILQSASFPPAGGFWMGWGLYQILHSVRRPCIRCIFIQAHHA